MPLYIGDWDGDTRHLDCEQDGAYGRLVRHYWRNGPLPDDDNSLSRVVGMQLARWRKVRPIIEAFFQVANGRWNHKRVDAERIKWADKKAKAAERAKEAADRRWHPEAPSPRPKTKRPKDASSNASSMPGAMLEQCPSPSSSKVEGLSSSPSTLTDGANADALPDGASLSPREPLEERQRLANEVKRGFGLRVVGS